MATRKKPRPLDNKDEKPETIVTPARERRGVGGSIAKAILDAASTSTAAPGRMTPGGVSEPATPATPAEAVDDVRRKTEMDPSDEKSTPPTKPPRPTRTPMRARKPDPDVAAPRKPRPTR